METLKNPLEVVRGFPNHAFPQLKLNENYHFWKWRKNVTKLRKFHPSKPPRRWLGPAQNLKIGGRISRFWCSRLGVNTWMASTPRPKNARSFYPFSPDLSSHSKFRPNPTFSTLRTLPVKQKKITEEQTRQENAKTNERREHKLPWHTPLASEPKP